MNATKADKLWAVASHPSTNDNEASNAFAMFRRALASEQSVDTYLRARLGVQGARSDPHWATMYNQLRERYDAAQRNRDEELKIIENEHNKVLDRTARRVREVETALRAKEVELTELKANGMGDELDIIAQRNAEIERLAVKLKALSASVKEVQSSRDRYAADKVAAAERAIREKLHSVFGTSANPEPESAAKPAPEQARAKSAASTKKPKSARPTAHRTNRKGADTESIVSSLLTNEWKSVSALFDGACRYGFTGVENAIRFAAERLVRMGNAEQGLDHKGHIAFRRA